MTIAAIRAVAAKMLDQSGGWEDCPFCPEGERAGISLTRTDAPVKWKFPWHTRNCLLREIAGMDAVEAGPELPGERFRIERTPEGRYVCIDLSPGTEGR